MAAPATKQSTMEGTERVLSLKVCLFSVVGCVACVLLLLPLILTPQISTPPNNAASFTIPASHPNFQYMGRFAATDDGSSRSFDWSSSTIRFTLFRKAPDGSNSSSFKAAAKLVDNDANWYKVIVNGEHAFDFPTSSESVLYPLSAQGFRYDEAHDVQLIKRTEARNNDAASVFFGLVLDDEHAELLPPPSRPPPTHQHQHRRILFFGDSITCGYGILGEDGSPICPESTTRLEDSHFSYGPIAARRFGAEYQVVAWSGKGVVHNYGDSSQLSSCPKCPMPSYSNRTIATDPSSAYPLHEFVPDAVVCNLGTNDFNAVDPQPTAHQFEAGYRQLVALFRQAHPLAEVFLACGPMTTHEVCQYVKSVAAATRAAYIDLMLLDQQDSSMWACRHPNLAGQQIMAQATIDAISKKMGWNTV